jgi:hypothetical protein
LPKLFIFIAKLEVTLHALGLREIHSGLMNKAVTPMTEGGLKASYRARDRVATRLILAASNSW